MAGLQVAGPGAPDGTLHVEAHGQAPGPVGEFKVTGALGGKKAAVLGPEA